MSQCQRFGLNLHGYVTYNVPSVTCHPLWLQENIIPESVRYWEDTLRVRHTVGPIKLLPQCVSDRVRYKDGDPHPYCVDGCAETTSCGETVVPPDHLDVSIEKKRVYSRFIQSQDSLYRIDIFMNGRCLLVSFLTQSTGFCSSRAFEASDIVSSIMHTH